MSSSDLIRWGGLAAMVSGVLFIVGDLLGLTVDYDNLSIAVTTPSFLIQHLLYLFGMVLLVGALLGFYTHQAEDAGILSVVGFFLAFLGTALSIGAYWSQVYVTPTLARLVPAILEILNADPPWGFKQAAIVFVLGWLLFGAAALRARTYPRAAVLLLIIGAVMTLFPFMPVPTTAFGVAVIWVGFVVFSRRGQEVQQTVSTSKST
jgi:hypothetical protein